MFLFMILILNDSFMILNSIFHSSEMVFASLRFDWAAKMHSCEVQAKFLFLDFFLTI